jgi:hypothetical protein
MYIHLSVQGEDPMAIHADKSDIKPLLDFVEDVCAIISICLSHIRGLLPTHSFYSFSCL